MEDVADDLCFAACPSYLLYNRNLAMLDLKKEQN